MPFSQKRIPPKGGFVRFNSLLGTNLSPKYSYACAHSHKHVHTHTHSKCSTFDIYNLIICMRLALNALFHNLIKVSLIKKTHNVFIVSVLSLISFTQTYALS